MNPPFWAREGLEPRGGRLHFAGRDAERMAREHGTPLYLYDPARLQANVEPAPGRPAARGGEAPRLLRAQGQSAPRLPVPPARPGRGGHRCLLAARDRPRPRIGMEGRGDLLHRHQPQPSRSRRHPRPPRGAQPRLAERTAAGGGARPGTSGRPAHQPAGGHGLFGPAHLRGRQADQVRRSTPTASTRLWRRRAGNASRSWACISTSVRAGSRAGSRRSWRRCAARPISPGACPASST